jgi:hypothetical protein
VVYIDDIVGVDFKVTRFPSDRSGEARLCSLIVEFSDCIFYQGLMELPLVGGTFTWSNNQESSSWSRIDRFCLSGVLQRKLHRLCSDHFPILLDYGNFQTGGKSFKFENM